ncbi:MAG: malate synthase, partial [Polaribacter sp.]
PNRDQVTMSSPFMSAYSLLVIQKCHKRGVHAMGGMAAQIPIKNDEIANDAAFAKVEADKELEVRNGHDGTWVAHPGLVAVAMDVFNKYMTTKNQIHNTREDVTVSETALVEMPKGTITEEGVRKNINVGILYIESWLRGNGAAAIYHLMEDAATAEISRTQVWLWLHTNVQLEGGGVFNKEMYQQLKKEELEKIKNLIGERNFMDGKFKVAIELFDTLVLSKDYKEFLTLLAYKHI